MFLKKVYKEWRAFFWLLMIFFVAQGVFMYKAVETVPFFLYHMFSHAHQPKDSMIVYLIKTPEGYFDHTQLSNREVEMLTNNIAYYDFLKKNDGVDFVAASVKRRFEGRFSPATYQYFCKSLLNDSSTIEKYPQWWLRYFTAITTKKYDSIMIVQSSVNYTNGFSKSPIDSVIFSVKP